MTSIKYDSKKQFKFQIYQYIILFIKYNKAYVLSYG
jgi:hypothetical protein